jgi:S-adenosylmethionine hydrolase
LSSSEEKLPHRPVITLTTDFGTNDHFVGALKGVILDITPEAEIVDISHAVQAFDVLDGALAISQAYSYFPNGTVHMVVVDPGVGTDRRPILASSDGYHFVAPDNGVLSMVYAREERMHVRHITSDHYFRMPVSNTFHARDIFAPVAAYLAKQVDSHKFGDEIEDYVKFAAPRPKATGEGRMRGVVLKIDRFGNLITNFLAADFPRALEGAFEFAIGLQEVTRLARHYEQFGPGELFAIVGSSGYFEISAGQASAARLLGVATGAPVELRVF